VVDEIQTVSCQKKSQKNQQILKKMLAKVRAAIIIKTVLKEFFSSLYLGFGETADFL
jgi:hypothetical protein